MVPTPHTRQFILTGILPITWLLTSPVFKGMTMHSTYAMANGRSKFVTLIIKNGH